MFSVICVYIILISLHHFKDISITVLAPSDFSVLKNVQVITQQNCVI